MYQRQLTDPDGNIIEFGYMDQVAAEVLRGRGDLLDRFASTFHLAA